MFELSPSPIDVRLVAFRIPIRVHWSFWVSSLVLGWDADRPDRMFIWVVCSFFSILIHELGHALTAEAFGWPTHILLFFGGGVAISERYRNHTPWRSILVSFMGPGAEFLLLAAVLAIQSILHFSGVPLNEYVHFAFSCLLLINFFYALFNLIPVLPLDGGQICASLCQILGSRDPMRLTLIIGAATSGLAAYYFFEVLELQFPGMLMLMLCVQSIYALQVQR